MLSHVRDFIRRFLSDPIGTAVEAGLYLVFLAVGIWVLVLLGKMAWAFVMEAIHS